MIKAAKEKLEIVLFASASNEIWKSGDTIPILFAPGMLPHTTPAWHGRHESWFRMLRTISPSEAKKPSDTLRAMEGKSIPHACTIYIDPPFKSNQDYNVLFT